ncbi:FAM177 family [Plasmopara halstedii]|uniref:FAM177 family n=1 Tax=Plasmopara halstedii TaxID=4781 RepID=A0A0P1B079_PLAHL|nr:FAM177 family [Plasmopara halstedii]CEG48045.1 FAM177 family [Plasmopara halstedii]|eukprot:XP_024584414.1 FAM177 family [Plasmopara halstedii]
MDTKARVDGESSDQAVKHLLSDKLINTTDQTSQFLEECSGVRLLPEFVWDWICWSGNKTFDILDFAGEVVANFLGLNQSKYQWIIDAQEREEQKKQQRRLEMRQRRQLCLEQLLKTEQRKLEELEIGARNKEAVFIDSSDAKH